MKRNKLLLSLIAILLLLATVLTSCTPVTPPEEPDPDDKPNPPVTDTKDPDKLYLVENGVPSFQFVYDFDGLSLEFRNHIFSAIDKLQKSGINAQLVADDFATSIRDTEVLIGTFNGREDYELSKYILGNKGYTVRVRDNKVILLGGSEESLKIAFDLFMSEYLKPDADGNITLDRSLDRTVREVYDVTSVSIGGVELNEGEFTFVCDPEDKEAVRAAELMQIRLYDSAGYYLEIKDKADGPCSIFVKTVEKSEEDGFRVYRRGESLYVECQYPRLFEAEMEKYLLTTVSESASGDIDIGGDYSKKLHTVSYLDFGAVGDGVTDDFAAIREAHEFANEYGLAIDACGSRKGDGLTFNLGQHASTIGILTDVIWTGATFIIDDTEIAPTDKARSYNIFSVISGLRVNTQLTGVLTSLPKDATNIGMTLDQKYLMIIYNSDIKQYIRYGANADSGASQQEVILVHENGDIDPSTPLLWNYDKITSVTLFPVSDTELTITGGVFITKANRAPREYTYYHRGISINRSNVTVRGVSHRVEGETDTGAPYNGFLTVGGANNVLFENVIYTGHKTYKLQSNVNNSMGSYDIAASNSNAITWRGCTQTNSITDSSRWGIMGSNYCKNLTYDNCKLSRFDAHKGMYNSTIKDSEIGHGGISAIGAGYLLIENTVVNHNNVVHLRADYGSTWDGEIIIRNVTLNNSSSSATLISATWYDHYFGYVCHLPSVTVDNLTVKKGTSVTVFSSFSSKDITSTSTKNPVVLGGQVKVVNNKNGYFFKISSNSYVNGGYTLVNG